MKRISVILTLAFVVCFTANIFADVIVTQSMTIETMGMGSSETTIVSKTKGDKDCTQMSAKSNSIMGMPAGQTENIIINRLDKGVSWVIHPQTKTYQEIKFSDIKKSLGSITEASSKSGEGDAEYTWTVTVEDLGSKAINGYNAKGIRGTAIGVSKKNPTEKTRVIYEIWFGQNLPGGTELIQHFRKLAELSGQDQLMNSEAANKIFSSVGPEFDKLTKAIAANEGFPVKTVISVEANIAEHAQDIDTTGMGDNPQAAAMMQSMKAMMGNASADGMTKVLSMSTQVMKIETTAVDEATFELPAGYKPL